MKCIVYLYDVFYYAFGFIFQIRVIQPLATSSVFDL